MTTPIRRAKESDLPAILDLERAAFQDYRQASEASLRRSIASPRQSFWVIPGPKRLDGILVLWHFRDTVRVYDIATHPEARGQGVGRRLMAHAEKLAKQQGARTMSLEAEEQDPRLVGWYEGMGFVRVARLKDFYHEGCSALRLRKTLA
ncbi:MAG: N-acetyltransferase [Candidatus Thermoplasmatota archaeon]